MSLIKQLLTKAPRRQATSHNPVCFECTWSGSGAMPEGTAGLLCFASLDRKHCPDGQTKPLEYFTVTHDQRALHGHTL